MFCEFLRGLLLSIRKHPGSWKCCLFWQTGRGGSSGDFKAGLGSKTSARTLISPSSGHLLAYQALDVHRRFNQRSRRDGQ